MIAVPPCVLAINAGSSSIKFAVYQADKSLLPGLHGKVDRIGLEGSYLIFNDPSADRQESLPMAAADHTAAIQFLIHWLEERQVLDSVKAVGHRIVHGMAHAEPALITTKLVAELHRIMPYAPNHLPQALVLIQALHHRHPDIPQLACFDTSFHCTMPRVARLLPIPRRYSALGVQRYGFHGLSYTYLMEELAALGDTAATQGRVILAHLGNGASLAAVCDGESLDTSMSFTPTSGLVMGTRSGDLDPGVLAFLSSNEKMSPDMLNRMMNHESGMLGISETSSDMRDLLAHEATDPRAAEAVALFCYQAKKWTGAFAAVLGGLDTLVFSGGIGENAPQVRSRICQGLDFLGIKLDEKRNAASIGVISTDGSRAKVRVIATDEELMIARSLARLLEFNGQKPKTNP
jgi:acetate kinase